jgi:transcriptional regulator with XRE-family HTH domain
MELREKIDLVIKEKGFSQRKFAESIGLNHISFNRNMKSNNITGEIVKALIEHLHDVDLNWLFKNENNGTLELNEPGEEYGSEKLNKLNKAISILEELKKDLSQQ